MAWRHAILIIGILGASWCCASMTGRAPDVNECTQSAEEAAVRAAIDAAWRDHIAAAKRKDASGVAAIYASDAIFVVSPEQVVRGRPALDEFEASGFASVDVIDATHATHHLRLCGDTAYELGTVSGPVRLQGRETRTVIWNFMASWRQQPDGSWRIACLSGR